jgi:hypothetical protein
MTVIYEVPLEVSFLLATFRKVKARKESSGTAHRAVVVVLSQNYKQPVWIASPNVYMQMPHQSRSIQTCSRDFNIVRN